MVEDAPAGITAARTAGCPVVGVLTTHDTLDAPTVASLDLIDVEVLDGVIRVSIPENGEH